MASMCCEQFGVLYPLVERITNVLRSQVWSLTGVIYVPTLTDGALRPDGNMSAIPRGAYLLKFMAGSAECFIHLAPCYIRAIAFLCAPLTRRKLHRSIAFTGRNSCLRACRKRGLS